MKIVKYLVLTSMLVLFSSALYAQLDWVKFNGEVPNNAVVGGVESHRELPICRCEFNGAMHPGKVVEKACNIGYGGAEKAIRSFEVLVNNGLIELSWIKSKGELPDHAIKAGREGNLDLYVGRAFHKGGTHPGKIFKVGDKYICNIGYGGKELTFTTFEFLVEHKLHPNAEILDHDVRCEFSFS